MEDEIKTETKKIKNYFVKKYSTLGEERIPYFKFMRPEKCQNEEESCPRMENILYPFNGKKFCFFCWSNKKYYSDNFGFEKGKETIIGKKVMKKNAFYSKAESLFEQKKITELDWSDFKSLYVTDKKKARRHIKRVFKRLGL